METLFIPNENDFKKWIKEAVKEFFQETEVPGHENKENEDVFLNRLQIF